jgi:hypothetical protein
LPCACGFSIVSDMASFPPDLFSWPRADSISLRLDFSSVLLLITGKTPQPIFSCATELLVPRRPHDSVSVLFAFSFRSPSWFRLRGAESLFVRQRKTPGNKPSARTVDLTFTVGSPCCVRLPIWSFVCRRPRLWVYLLLLSIVAVQVPTTAICQLCFSIGKDHCR